MSLPDDRGFRKLFLKARQELICLSPNDENQIENLHNALLESSLQYLENVITVGKPNPGFFYSLLESRININPEACAQSKNLSLMAREIDTFREYPSVIASLFELNPEQDKKGKSTLGSKYGDSHSARKRSGQFFTPLAVADFICHEALDSFLDINQSKIDDLKILDPSVGAGIFLDSMLNAMRERNISNRKIIAKLWGIDRNRSAIELSKRILGFKNRSKNADSMNLLVGDFLLDNLPHPSFEYDIIIGNPPYISYYSRESQPDDDIKSQLDHRYGDLAGGSLNTFLHFIVRGIELLDDGGVLCFIIPDRLLWNRRYRRIREHILKTAPPLAIYTTTEKIFPDATVDSAIIILAKHDREKKKCDTGELIVNKKTNTISVINKKHVDPSDFLSEKEIRFIIRHPLLAKIEKSSTPLREIANIRDGINPAFDEFRRKIISQKKRGKSYRPLIEGCDIHPFRIIPRELYINYDSSLVTPELKKRGVSLRQRWVFDAKLKLVSRQTADKLIFALDENKLCDLNSVHNTILRDGVKYEILYYILGLMNSRLMNFYYRNMSYETSKSFPQVHIADLEELPVKIPDDVAISEIQKIVKKIISGKREIESLLEKLDCAIFEIYRISENERNQIIKATGREWRL